MLIFFIPPLVVLIPGLKMILSDKSYCDPLEPHPVYLSYLYAKKSYHKNKGVSSKSVTGHIKKFTFLFPSVNVISTTDKYIYLLVLLSCVHIIRVLDILIPRVDKR